MSKYSYTPCRESDIPDGIRFDVARHNQGQIVEVAYGGHGRAEHCVGDAYKRVTDKSDGSVSYYRLA